MRIGERRQFKSTSHLFSRTVTVNFFRLFWIVLLVWEEVGLFFWSISSCKWPDVGKASTKPTRVLLLSDPQVQLPSVLRHGSARLGSLRRFIFELNLKKSWHVASRLRPHAIIFLGDMLANGKSIKNEVEYQQYAQKFKSIFTSDPSVSVYYIPGNNDIGMGVSSDFSQRIRQNYVKAFGPSNQQITIRNHTFVLLDAPGLVDEDYQRSASGSEFDTWREMPGRTVAFVKSVTRDDKPLILLSHIPLARPGAASCGPLREKGTIRQGVGHGYQNTLGKQTTAFLLQSLKPSIIFSGDNRDYCDYTHVNKKATDPVDVREVTVKSFSLANHIRRPGFQLLSLSSPPTRSSDHNPSHPSFMDTPCHLPDQHGVYFSTYGTLFILNAVFLLILAMYRRRQLRKRIPHIEPLALSPHDSSSGGSENTPSHSHDPESAIWSPYTPAAPTSPRSALPSYLRTPNAASAAGPTFRASRPSTPASPLPTPMVYPPEDEDEAMYPMQYATRRERHEDQDDHNQWTPGHDRISSDPQIPHFTLAPRSRLKYLPHNSKAGAWSWSWTFVFRGRRRRMRLAAPVEFLESLGELTEPLFRYGEKSAYRSVLSVAFVDGLHIFWPAALLWSLLAWWMY